THAGRRTARRPGRGLQIGRTVRVRAVAVLGHVAHAGLSAAERARVAGRMRAGVQDAVADVERADVRVARARRVQGLLVVGRAVHARAVAVLGRITLAGRRATDHEGARDAVGRTRLIGRARAVLGHVTHPGRAATHGAARRDDVRRTGLTGRAGAVLVRVTQIARARVADGGGGGDHVGRAGLVGRARA